MSVDREQVRRDADTTLTDTPGDPGSLEWNTARFLARHCLALLAELEQAERESDDWLRRAESLALAIDQRERERITTEARLAAVPALVDAAHRLLLRRPRDTDLDWQHLADALAAYEQERKP